MNTEHTTSGHKDSLGNPDIELANLQIWIQGREFPNAIDYWDGNWLQMTAHCSAPGADVWANGPFIHIADIIRSVDSCERLSKSFPGEAYFGGVEPELSVTLVADRLGNITMTVDITPSYLTQRHSFEFAIDQSYLPAFISACRNILSKYPIRGKPDNEQ